IALGRVGLGLLLLIAFSSGLAIVLMGIGVLVLYAKHFLPDSQRAAAHPAFRIIPVVSAALIVCIGLLMTGVSLGWIQPNRLAGRVVNPQADCQSAFLVGQAIVFRGLPSSSTARRRQTTIVCATPVGPPAPIAPP